MSISENIKNTLSTIPNDVLLVAVSKVKPKEDIMEAYEASIRDFGENKVQEFADKYEELPKDIRWHFIGHLQKNKVKYIVGKTFLIHSLDSIELASEIEKHYKKNNLVADTLIQINIGKEDSKFGIIEEDIDKILEYVENLENLKVLGLMAIIPICDESNQRMYFKRMKEIFDTIHKREYKNSKMKYLSMGMTDDYKIAIEEGANVVRIGRHIFGERNYKI